LNKAKLEFANPESRLRKQLQGSDNGNAGEGVTGTLPGGARVLKVAPKDERILFVVLGLACPVQLLVKQNDFEEKASLGTLNPKP
jgi:hypothetical protein